MQSLLPCIIKKHVNKESFHEFYPNETNKEDFTKGRNIWMHLLLRMDEEVENF